MRQTVPKFDAPAVPTRAYPERVQPWRMKNGTPVLIRPIQPQDEPLMVKFHQGLSDKTVYLRYFKHLKLSSRIAPDRLAQVCAGDPARESVLVAENLDHDTAERQIIAVGRINMFSDKTTCEIAVVVCDAFQLQGLGSELLRRLLQLARERGARKVVANLLPENEIVRAFLKKQTFPVQTRVEDGMITAELELGVF